MKSTRRSILNVHAFVWSEGEESNGKVFASSPHWFFCNFSIQILAFRFSLSMQSDDFSNLFFPLFHQIDWVCLTFVCSHNIVIDSIDTRIKSKFSQPIISWDFAVFVVWCLFWLCQAMREKKVNEKFEVKSFYDFIAGRLSRYGAERDKKATMTK